MYRKEKQALTNKAQLSATSLLHWSRSFFKFLFLFRAANKPSVLSTTWWMQGKRSWWSMYKNLLVLVSTTSVQAALKNLRTKNIKNLWRREAAERSYPWKMWQHCFLQSVLLCAFVCVKLNYHSQSGSTRWSRVQGKSFFPFFGADVIEIKNTLFAILHNKCPRELSPLLSKPNRSL